MADPLTVKDGFATAPERPGHGIEFDWEQLETLKVSA
jgi:L-alanine-DL-glutamate epimerase-like enolase superfamily enzyme